MTWQPAPILYPDVEFHLATSLRLLLAQYGEPGMFVGREVPNPRRKRMVLVTRDGGSPSELRDRPRVRVRVYDETEKAANDLAALVAAIFPLLAGDGVVTRVEHLSGPVEIPDAAPQRYLLMELHTRGEAIA